MIERQDKFDQQIDQALDLLNRGKLQEGKRMIDTLAQTHADHQKVHYALGAYYVLTGDDHQAIAYFEQAVRIAPDFAQAYFNKAAAHQHLGEIKPTLRAFLNVVKYGDPHELYVQQAQEFLAGFAKVVTDYEGVSLATYLAGGDAFDEGVICMRQHDWQAAITCFERSLTLTPRHAQSHGNIGLCYLKLGRKHLALEAFDRALAIDPEYALARHNRLLAMTLTEGEPLQQEDIPLEDYYLSRWLEKEADL